PSFLRRSAIATFSFDDGIRTVGLPMAWALRTRVNRSAMGSVMLMKTSFRVHRYPIKPEINQIVSRHKWWPALRRPPTIAAFSGFGEYRCGSRTRQLHGDAVR